SKMQQNSTLSAAAPAPSATASPAGPAHCDVSSWTASVLMPAVYSLVFCVGLPANALALLVLCRKGGRLKAAMKVLGAHWPFLDVPCRLAGSLYYVSTYCSVCFMTLISVNRYRTLTATRHLLPMLRRKGAASVSALTWFAWLACAVPSLSAPQLRLDSGLARCFQDVEPRMALAACGFSAVSFLTVFFCYVSILASLGVRPPRQGLHRRRAKAVVLGMLLVFLGCVLPYHGTLLLWALQRSEPRCPSPAHHITTALLSASSAVNPLVYCFSLPQFRSALRAVPLLQGMLGGHSLPPPPANLLQKSKGSSRSTQT
ncbi:platelet-activating factor receptor-like, partial [Scleropages formosus]